jgi:L-asparaginase II
VAARYQPMVELTRGRIVESVHFGAVAVVDSAGNLLASYGDPHVVTFLRSSAKPFQALPFVEREGDLHFGFVPAELALICASHSGTEQHVSTLRSLQAKVGVRETDLQCGVHEPYDKPTADALRTRGEIATANRHNCSGKHTGMLAHARLRDLPLGNYLDLDGPVQQSILETFSTMAGLPAEQVEIGIDGCSAPNFAIPLVNAALALARLCDPRDLAPRRADACRRITSAMSSEPNMVAGPGRFDTLLMGAAGGRIVAKAGAESYQALGILPGVLGPDSPGVGIAMKISDGDPNSRARPLAALEVLRQLGALAGVDMGVLSAFGPQILTNHRGLAVGESRPAFTLKRQPTAETKQH